MIVLPSIAFGGFSGSAKDVTARNVHGRTILGVRSWPTGETTSAQVARRASMSKITKSYKTLTAAQMLEWERLAEHTSGASVFGQKAQLSGVNLYVRLNVNRVMAGEAMIQDAPASVVSIGAASCRDIIIAPSIVILNGIKHLPAPNKLVVKMSAPVSPGISNGWSKTVVLSSEVEDDWGGADVTEFYTKTIGIAPVVGQKVFVELYWVDTATGFTGQAEKASVIVMTDEEAEAASRSSRSRITTEDLGERSTVSDCEVEFTTGAPVIFFDVLSQGMDGVSQSEIYPKDGLPDDMRGTSYILCRAHKEGDYSFALNTVQFLQNTYYGDCIKINPASASNNKESEIFGVGILI